MVKDTLPEWIRSCAEESDRLLERAIEYRSLASELSSEVQLEADDQLRSHLKDAASACLKAAERADVLLRTLAG